MIKETITYTDYDGVERTEEFYFNLSRAELTEMEMTHEGGLSKFIEKVVNAKEGTKIIELFQWLLEKSYGVKSPDGRKFIKNQEVWEDFKQTEAYSILFMKLSTEADYSAKFVNGITSLIKKKPTT